MHHVGKLRHDLCEVFPLVAQRDNIDCEFVALVAGRVGKVVGLAVADEDLVPAQAEPVLLVKLPKLHSSGVRSGAPSCSAKPMNPFGPL